MEYITRALSLTEIRLLESLADDDAVLFAMQVLEAVDSLQYGEVIIRIKDSKPYMLQRREDTLLGGA